MRTFSITMLCIAAVICAGTVSSECISKNPEKAVEQLLFFRLITDADLDSSTMAEVLDGYAMYTDSMTALSEKRAAMKEEIQAAIDAGETGYALTQKVDALMALDKEIFAAKQSAVQEAGSVLDSDMYAKLYLLVSELDKQIAKTRDLLAGKGICPMGAAGTCPKAAGVCAVGAPEAAAAAEVSPEEAIMAGVKLFTEKLAKQDIDGLMVAFSDDFENYEYGDKEGMKMFLEQAADMGYLEGLEVSLEDAEVKIDGDEATVYPVDASGAFGSITLELTLSKKNGEWKITGLDAAGM